jgi:large subunit ribosomal protein L9
MEVILLKDVPKVGRAFEKHSVTAGYARNYLIPGGLAEVASKAAIARSSLKRSLQEERHALQSKELEAALQKLDGESISIVSKANEKGHLFQGIHKEQVLSRVNETYSLSISEDSLEGDFPIKEVGDHVCTLKSGDKKASFQINIESAA